MVICDGLIHRSLYVFSLPDGLTHCMYFSDHKCIHETDVCDGMTQCRDGSDEENCEDWICPKNMWKCWDNVTCIRVRG